MNQESVNDAVKPGDHAYLFTGGGNGLPVRMVVQSVSRGTICTCLWIDNELKPHVVSLHVSSFERVVRLTDGKPADPANSKPWKASVNGVGDVEFPGLKP